MPASPEINPNAAEQVELEVVAPVEDAEDTLERSLESIVGGMQKAEQQSAELLSSSNKEARSIGDEIRSELIEARMDTVATVLDSSKKPFSLSGKARTLLLSMGIILAVPQVAGGETAEGVRSKDGVKIEQVEQKESYTKEYKEMINVLLEKSLNSDVEHMYTYYDVRKPFYLNTTKESDERSVLGTGQDSPREHSLSQKEQFGNEEFEGTLLDVHSHPYRTMDMVQIMRGHDPLSEQQKEYYKEHPPKLPISCPDVTNSFHWQHESRAVDAQGVWSVDYDFTEEEVLESMAFLKKNSGEIFTQASDAEKQEMVNGVSVMARFDKLYAVMSTEQKFITRANILFDNMSLLDEDDTWKFLRVLYAQMGKGDITEQSMLFVDDKEAVDYFTGRSVKEVSANDLKKLEEISGSMLRSAKKLGDADNLVKIRNSAITSYVFGFEANIDYSKPDEVEDRIAELVDAYGRLGIKINFTSHDEIFSEEDKE